MNILKKIIPKSSKLYFKLSLINKIGLKLWLINCLFQRIFRRHSRLNFNVNFTSTISESNIELNKDLTTLASFAISGGCYFQAINGIKLGKNFLFAPGVKIISANHDFNEHSKSIRTSPIIIGDNVWLGANVIILPGVRIGNGCVVGAGSVVTKSFEEENLIIAGNPAKIIGKNK
jgi:acetyltransferase-like isoleucine patch superfamily enzyme